MSCIICIKNYTRKHRIKITCLECNRDVCSTCFVKYIIYAPCCMYCKAPVHICLYRNLISARKYAHVLKLNFEKTLLIEKSNLIKKQDKKEIIQSTILDVIRCTRCWGRLEVCMVLNCVSCKTVFCASCFSGLESDKSTHICVTKMKQCPKCYNLIEKEDVGCDQMFCILCNTTFSWSTGLIVDVATRVHNPDYYNWKRKTGELPRDELDNRREGIFYMKCESSFKDQKIKLSETYKMFGFPSVIEVDKTEFLLNFHKMFLNTLVEVSTRLDLEADTRHNLLIYYISNVISLSSWKRNLRKHSHFIKQCEAIKYNILKTLDRLYTVVLDENYNDTEIEKLCLESVHQTENILMS